MDEQANLTRTKDFKRLLERLEHVTPPSDTSVEHVEERAPDQGPPPLPPQASPAPIAEARALPLPPALKPPPGWRPPRREAGMGTWGFVLATGLNTVVAAVLAIFITLQAMDADGASVAQEFWQRVTSAQEGTGAASAEVPTSVSVPEPATSVFQLAQLGSAEAPLRFEPQRPSPFPLRLEPPDAERDAYILVLSGLPDGSRLTGADQIGADNWLLAPGGVDALRLTIPALAGPAIEVGIELRRPNGMVAATSTAWLTTIAPVTAREAAPPRPEAKPAEIDRAAVSQASEQSKQLLARGDIAGARILYERAAGRGDGEAAFMLASTYDPNRLWALGVFGMIGNKELAKQWYLRAEQLGHSGAAQRMRLLDD